MTIYEPDILAKGLDVVFCGLNPASTAAAVGHNFSSGSNRFWLVLHLAGFTDVRLRPHDERNLLDYGCGITAVVRRPTKSADEVSPKEYRQAKRKFESRIRYYTPRCIAFLGKRAVLAMTGKADVQHCVRKCLSWKLDGVSYASVAPCPSRKVRKVTE